MPSRKPVKPIQEPTASEAARHTNVLLEGLRAEFKVFGEGLKAVHQKLDSTFDQVGRNTEALGRVEDRLSVIEKDVGELKSDMKDVKGRLATVEAR